MGTCAVSRYKLSRSDELITVQDNNCEQMRESGCINHHESVMVAEAKAKTVTSNLLQLTVLGDGHVSNLSSWHISLLCPVFYFFYGVL